MTTPVGQELKKLLQELKGDVAAVPSGTRYAPIKVWFPSRTRYVVLEACTVCGCLVASDATLKAAHEKQCP